MANDKIICFRANSNEAELIDDIARRHGRSRSSLLNMMVKTILTLDKKGALESFLLSQSENKEGLTK
jgi:hypothetical protein